VSFLDGPDGRRGIASNGIVGVSARLSQSLTASVLCAQIATYKVRTVRVVDEQTVADSASDANGHVAELPPPEVT
jgi:hypothetical protein